MKKLALIVASSMALLGAQTATAQTYSPAPSTWTWKGSLVVQKGMGPVLTCAVTVTANVTSATSATATASIAPGDLGCITVSFTGAPYAITWNAGPPETVTLKNVYVNTSITPGNCKGDITATFNDTTNDALVVNTSIPQDTTGGACTMRGTLFKTAPAGPIDIS